MNPAQSSYLKLRQFIGILGISLPVVLVLGSFAFSSCYIVQPSISHYYYTVMHIAFVGVLCALGSFLFNYIGTQNFENIVSNIAGVCSFLIAAFPTGTKQFLRANEQCYCSSCLFIDNTICIPYAVVVVHFTSATLLFVCFAIFCFKFFTMDEIDETKQDMHYKRQKAKRNWIYKFCGWGIVISILAIGGFKICDAFLKWDEIYNSQHKSFSLKNCIKYYYTIFFETTALFCFGTSWLIKGSTNWKESESQLLQLLGKWLR